MTEENIPDRPQRPDANECCGGGCVPCIYDYYYEKLAKWESKYGAQSSLKPILNQERADKRRES